MADSSVLIDQGSATAMDTRTEATNGQHRQVVVLGDPATNAGVAPVDVTFGLKVDRANTATATLTNVTASTSNVTLLASNAARRGAMFVNDSTAILYIKFGATASTTSYTVCLAPTAASIPSYYELPYPCYTGIIDCISSAANGSIRCTEL